MKKRLESAVSFNGLGATGRRNSNNQLPAAPLQTVKRGGAARCLHGRFDYRDAWGNNPATKQHFPVIRQVERGFTSVTRHHGSDHARCRPLSSDVIKPQVAGHITRRHEHCRVTGLNRRSPTSSTTLRRWLNSRDQQHPHCACRVLPISDYGKDRDLQTSATQTTRRPPAQINNGNCGVRLTKNYAPATSTFIFIFRRWLMTALP